MHPALASAHRYVGRLGRRLADDRCFMLAGSLTYTTLLALVPLATIAITVVSAFPVFQEFTLGVEQFLERHMLPPSVAKTLLGYIEQFVRGAAQLTAVGVAILGVTAVLLMLSIERAFDAIWRVGRPRRTLAFRLLMYWAVLTLGPILVGVSLTMTSYIVGRSLDAARQMPWVASVTLALLPGILTAVAFTLLYRLVPNRPVDLRHALAGGVVAAALFELMKRGFASYLAHFPAYTMVYGALAVIPIFLVWIYLSWVVILLGAELAASLPDARAAGNWRERQGGAPLRDALEILRVLVQSQRDARPLDTRRIAREAGVARESAYDLLERMAARGWVASTGGDRWTLSCDSGSVKVADVFKALVFQSETDRRQRRVAEIEAVMQRAITGTEQSLDIPLRLLVGDGGDDKEEAGRAATR